MTTVESRKYEGAIYVVCEEYIMESTFLAKLFIRVWFNVVTELEEYLYLHPMLFLIEFIDFAGIGGVKGCCSDTGYICYLCCFIQIQIQIQISLLSIKRKIVLFQVFTTSKFDKHIHINKGIIFKVT